MTTTRQPEPHLDADQLNAFAEGALTAPERAVCLQHLAECAHCREIAFLAGASLLPEEAVPTAARRFSFTWPALSLGAGALAAGVITVTLLHYTHQRATPSAIQIATGSPTPSMSRATVAEPPIQMARPEREVHSAPKPSQVLKAAPKPEAAPPYNQQLSYAASDTAAAPARPTAGAAQQLSAGRALGGVSNAPAAPAAQPLHAQAGPVAKAEPDLALRAYNATHPSHASDGSAEISGTITDSSGATIPRAKIMLDQASGTAHRETLTDGAGRFIISSLQPGKYRLEITSPGFKSQVREIEIGTSQLARVDSQLAVGAASETVEVQAADATVNTESVSVQSTLPGKEPIQTSVSSGKRTVALDSSGRLFLNKKAGRHWKVVHGPWKNSAVTFLSLTPNRQFKVTTAQGSWLSSDGEHWSLAN